MGICSLHQTPDLCDSLSFYRLLEVFFFPFFSWVCFSCSCCLGFMGMMGSLRERLIFSYLPVHSNEETDFPLLTVLLAKKNAKSHGNFTILVGSSFTLQQPFPCKFTDMLQIILTIFGYNSSTNIWVNFENKFYIFFIWI